MTAACATFVSARPAPEVFLLGTRDSAAPLRGKVETALKSTAESVCVDFQGLVVTQSFMDEFLGMLILRYGPTILERVVLQNCDDDVKAVAEFVAKIRVRDFQAERK